MQDEKTSTSEEMQALRAWRRQEEKGEKLLYLTDNVHRDEFLF